LILEASIKPLIKLVPSGSVTLRGKPGEIKSVNLSIYAGLNKPLKIETGKSNLDGNISYALEEVEKGKQYKINFRNSPDSRGDFRGYLRLGTNYKEKPEITIRVHSRFY
jgi:hypothetical protein